MPVLSLAIFASLPEQGEMYPWVGFNHVHLTKRKLGTRIRPAFLFWDLRRCQETWLTPFSTSLFNLVLRFGSHSSSRKTARGGHVGKTRLQRPRRKVELRLLITFTLLLLLLRGLLQTPPAPPCCCMRVSVANQQEIHQAAERVRQKPILSQTGAAFPPWSTASKDSCLTGRVFHGIWFAHLR